jgi:ABC-type lipoprotein export system ATPase subunit
MKITLNQFIPKPLAETHHKVSDVWEKTDLWLNSASVSLIISESGKGKSSLISSIYGIRKDYHGTILIEDKNIAGFSAADWSKIRQKELSIVFQSLKLFPEISAWDNIQSKNHLQNYKSDSEIEQLFIRLGMADYAEQIAGSLSFGQQQRIAIIRALCQPFSVILLDEPFSHLDHENAKLAWELIREESNQQNAQIIITGLSNTNFIKPNQSLYL